MTVRVFYHAADLDGHCSGAIVKYKYPDAVLYPINYGDGLPWDEIQSDDEVYMVDFCLQPFAEMGKLNRLLKATSSFVWIDHHKSALKSYRDYQIVNTGCGFELEGFRDISKAACELTWEYLFGFKRPIPLAVKLLSLYDSWTYQGHGLEDLVLPFQMRMRLEDLDPKVTTAMYKWEDLFERDCLDRGYDKVYEIDPHLIEEGEILLRFDTEQKKRYARTYSFETVLVPFCDVCNRKTGLSGYDPNFCTHQLHYSAIAINLGHTNSKVFDSVYDPEKHDLMITFSRRSDKKWNVSLYSLKPEIDCGAIAKSFGGGGHKGAGGFQVVDLPFEY